MYSVEILHSQINAEILEIALSVVVYFKTLSKYEGNENHMINLSQKCIYSCREYNPVTQEY
jgi:hypothetical protein